MAALATASGAGVTRGPVEDVLSRFVQAASEHGADVVVRITADCPLVDPAVIDRVVRARADEDAEYAGNVEPPTYPDGYDVEVLTAACLARLDREAVLPHEREHVTARVREHPGEFRAINVALGPRQLVDPAHRRRSRGPRARGGGAGRASRVAAAGRRDGGALLRAARPGWTARVTFPSGMSGIVPSATPRCARRVPDDRIDDQH